MHSLHHLLVGLLFYRIGTCFGRKFEYTVLGVKISHGHDFTSYATLGHFEVEL